MGLPLPPAEDMQVFPGDVTLAGAEGGLSGSTEVGGPDGPPEIGPQPLNGTVSLPDTSLLPGVMRSP